MDEPGAVLTGEGGEARGVLAEIIRTPLFKEILNNYLSEIDPKAGAETARTLIWEDPELILSLLASVPSFMNWMIAFLNEIAKEASEKFPPQLLKQLLENMGTDIDKGMLGECAVNYATLIRGVLEESPELEGALLAAVKGPVAAATGRGLDSAARYVNEKQREDPAFLGDLFSSVVSRVDGREFSVAAASVANAALDLKPPLVSWGWRLMKERIKKRFGG